MMGEMQPVSRHRYARGVTASITAALLSLTLGACSQVPEPTENIDSLTQVTEAPLPPAAAEEYDFVRHPAPIVKPLECTPYLVITSRGTGEPNKGQLLSPVARAVKKAHPDAVKVHNLDYPADTNVNEGGTYGVRLLLDTLRVQNDACPQQVFALLGYSQGALIVGDALSTPDGRLVGGTVGELSDDVAAQIAAVVLYGNPRFSSEESYDVGNFDKKLGGVLPRTPGSLQSFAERVQDFCVTGDFICQSSLDLDEKGHVSYFKNGMQQKGADFVLAQFAATAARALAPEVIQPEDAPAAAE